MSRAPAWDGLGRWTVFLLSSTSVGSLLAEFWGAGSMRTFTFWVMTPASGLLIALTVASRWRGDGRLAQAVIWGALAGLIAAVAYDLFRLPFVYARAWGLDGLLTALNLFKVFPRFGVLILGQPLEQPHYSWSAQCVGWAYHFSNGATFGVMYLAMVGDPARRHWLWAAVFALGLELGMLLTPYPRTFGIAITPAFIAVTLSAHLIFGCVLGLACRWFAMRSQPEAKVASSSVGREA